VAIHFTTRIESNIGPVLDKDAKALVAAMRKVVVGRAKWGVGRIRRDIVAAGYGTRVGNAVRFRSKDIEAGVEATIYSKAKVRHAGGVFDLIALYQQDLHISSQKNARTITTGFMQRNITGTFLTIPNVAVTGRSFRGRQKTVFDFPRGFFIAKVTAAGGVLVAKDDPDGPAYFFLTPYARQRGRLSLAKTKALIGRDLSVQIIRDWRRRRVTVALQLLAAA
jgi:hypothetical protein